MSGARRIGETFRMRLPRRLRIWLDCYIAADPIWRLTKTETELASW